MSKKPAFVVIACLVFLFVASSAFAVFCPQCGAKNDDSAKFCSGCGLKLGQTDSVQKAKEAVSGSAADLAGIVERASPSVVLVRTLTNELNAQFQDRGSGFVVDKEGHVITNCHVLGDMDDLDGINVLLSDKKECKASVLLCDYSSDLVVLSIKSDNLFPAKIGSSEKLASGEKVFVIGNPMGLEKSTSSGIVSAKDRILGTYEYEGLIQTDAAVNPGNSGGPLFNAQGEVVGVTSLGMPKWFSEGLNFAINSDLLTDVVKNIPAGKIRRPWIGIALLDLTPNNKQWEEVAHDMKIAESDGALVKSIAEGMSLNLKKGDIVIKINDFVVTKSWDLQKQVLKMKVGDEVSLAVRRGGKTISLKATLAEKSLEARFPIEDEVDIVFGATFSEQNGRIRIEKIKPDALADGMGFDQGNEIRRIKVNKKQGGEEINTGSVDNFLIAFRKAYNYKRKFIEWNIYYSDAEDDWYTDWENYLQAITTA